MAEIKYMTKFRTIHRVEVERSTEKSVWVKKIGYMGRDRGVGRHNKTSDFICYFDTWEEAKNHLVKKQERKVQQLKESTARENSILGQLKALKNLWEEK